MMIEIGNGNGMTYINRTKVNDHYCYYLCENYGNNGTTKRKYVASLGREPPIFYKPTLIQGYCEDYLRTIPPSSIDLIVDDPPYGITDLPWDEIPNWNVLAELYHTILDDNGLVYVFGKQPSLIEVYNSFKKYFDFRFEMIWNRNNVPWSSNYKPLPIHENIFVFCKKETRIENTKFFTKQVMTNGKPYYRYRKKNHPASQNAFDSKPYVVNNKRKRYPKSILEVPPVIHKPEYLGYPTQKPLDLIRWVILASSQRNNIVLDPHAGSGTTLLAALGLSRKSIGIELHQKAYDIAQKRIQEAIEKLPKNYILEPPH